MSGDKTIFRTKASVTIPVEEYEELVASQKFLEALQGCGVDNWEGYDAAQEMIDD